MPAGTSWTTFNQARLTGETRTTQAIDALYAAQDPAVVAALGQAVPFTGLPEPFLGALRARGLSTLELEHVRRWPDDQKERVRAAVANAISSGLSVRFAWKLHDGNGERTVIQSTSPTSITITFFSPWRRVRPTGPDEVTVDVG